MRDLTAIDQLFTRQLNLCEKLLNEPESVEEIDGIEEYVEWLKYMQKTIRFTIRGSMN
jgi:hypothetical protein